MFAFHSRRRLMNITNTRDDELFLQRIVIHQFILHPISHSFKLYQSPTVFSVVWAAHTITFWIRMENMKNGKYWNMEFVASVTVSTVWVMGFGTHINDTRIVRITRKKTMIKYSKHSNIFRMFSYFIKWKGCTH